MIDTACQTAVNEIRVLRVRDSNCQLDGLIPELSIHIVDGGNPSPLGEEKVRVTWSRATLPTGSAHEDGPQGARGVHSEVSEAGAHGGGGRSCARLASEDCERA